MLAVMLREREKYVKDKTTKQIERDNITKMNTCIINYSQYLNKLKRMTNINDARLLKSITKITNNCKCLATYDDAYLTSVEWKYNPLIGLENLNHFLSMSGLSQQNYFRLRRV